MRRVICFGEALIDFVAAPGAQDGPRPFLRQAGGAPANVAVAVARLGGESAFVGQVGRDMFGDFLVAGLRDAGVDTTGMRQTDAGPTALAFVELDANGERRFSFYRHGTADLQLDARDWDDRWLTAPAILHLCSNTLTEPPITETTDRALDAADAAGALISFDVNLRPALWPVDRDPAPWIRRVAYRCDVLKLTVEELHCLADGQPADQTIDAILAGRTRLILVTDGPQTFRWYSRHGNGELEPPRVTAVDTTACGDAFMGGFLFHLAGRDVGPLQFDEFLADAAVLERACRFALACGAAAATRRGAQESLPTLADMDIHP